MGFTDLISKLPIGKSIAPSNYDKKNVVALIKKKLFNFRSVGYSNKKQVEDTFIFVWANSENSNDVILRKKTIASILNLVSFYLKICNFDPFQSEICRECFRVDYHEINYSKINISKFSRFYFLFLHSNYLKSPV